MNRKAKQKLGEYDLQVCDNLRQAIIDDYGNPSFKEKVLDLINKLENDAKEMLGVDSTMAKQAIRKMEYKSTIDSK